MYKCMPSAFFSFLHKVSWRFYSFVFSHVSHSFLVVCSQRQTETSTLPLDVSLCLCKHTSRDELAFYSSNFHLLHFLLSCWGEGIWVEWIIQDEIIWTLTIWRWMILEWVAVRSLVVNHRYHVHLDRYIRIVSLHFFTLQTSVAFHLFHGWPLAESRYSKVRNKHSRTLINFLTFIQGLRPYSGLHSIR